MLRCMKHLKDYNDKYEYILPEVTVDKNLLSNKFGNLDLQSNLKFHNYDTNKLENFLVNDFAGVQMICFLLQR